MCTENSVVVQDKNVKQKCICENVGMLLNLKFLYLRTKWLMEKIILSQTKMQIQNRIRIRTTGFYTVPLLVMTYGPCIRLLRESAKKFCFNGPASKRGGGGKVGPLRKNNFLEAPKKMWQLRSQEGGGVRFQWPGH